MLFEITYSFFWFLLIFLSLRYFKVFQIEGLTKWDLPTGFLFKVISSFIFINVYTYVYGFGNFTDDAKDFIGDGKILNDIFYESPGDYFRLLTGIGENDEIIKQHLRNTIKWSFSNLILTNDSKNIVRINSVIHFFSFNVIYIHFFVFSLVSTLGIKQLYLSFKEKINVNPRIFFYSLILLPSLLFWSSGVLKEPFLILGIGLFTRTLFDKNLSTQKKFIFFFLSFFLLLNFKPYVLICLMIASTYYLTTKLVFSYKNVYSAIFFSVLLVLIVTVFKTEKHQLVNYISRKQIDFENIGKGGLYAIAPNDSLIYYFPIESYSCLNIDSGYMKVLKPTKTYSFVKNYDRNIVKYNSFKDTVRRKILLNQNRSESYFETTLILSSFRQLIFNIPEALQNSLLRPFPNDPGRNLKYISVVETWLLLLLFVFAILKRKILEKEDRTLVISFLVFIVSLSLIIGWTTPVLGAIVRYRVPVYLAILLLIFIIINSPEKWKKKETTS